MQYEIRDREKRIREEEERRKAGELAKKSPPKSPETEPDGARSPEQISEREPAVQPAPTPLGMISLNSSEFNLLLQSITRNKCFLTGNTISCMCVCVPLSLLRVFLGNFFQLFLYDFYSF